MKNLLIVQRGTTIHRRTARLFAIALFAVLLSATPFNAAFAQTAPALGLAANFAVLDGTEVTCTAPGSITGNVGVVSGTFTNTTGCTIVGQTPPATNLTAVPAYDDFLTAYTSLTNYQCNGLLATAYTTTAITLTPGVYCNGAAVTFTNTTLTLDAQNNPNAVWIFKIGTTLPGALTGTNFKVVMINGGSACNVYWWVDAAVTMTTSLFQGNILAGTAITFTDVALAGRALAGGIGTPLAPIGAVDMTRPSVVSCGTTTPPPIPPVDFCRDICKDYCKDDHHPARKHCNQGVGNGPENCDPGNSNQGDDDRSNDEHGGKPGDPGRKGGNDKDHDRDHDKDHGNRR